MQTHLKNNSAMSEMRYKLERNQTKLYSLLQKLNSYRCEPTNYEYFERLLSIRDDIKSFKNQHKKLYKEFSTGEFSDQENLANLMQEEISSFKELDVKIGAYLLDTVGC